MSQLSNACLIAGLALAGAAIRYAGQFAFQRLQPGDPAPDIGQLRARHLVGLQA